MALWLALVGCGADPAAQELTVLAAASLTDVYGDLEAAFEAAHPGVEVTVSFAGSQTLATQIRHGIAADVFASADARHVEALASDGLVGAPRPFAANELVLAVSAADRSPVDLASLGEAERLVVGAPDVPVGRYTATLLDAAQARYGDVWREQVEARIVSREPSVRQVASKVALGEADAAVVYATDVASVRGVRAVALPPELAVRTEYFHARVLSASRARELATRWMAFVEGEAGQRALSRRGFAPVPTNAELDDAASVGGAR
jgi:molybdate transport system substrate-binding protein